MRPLPYPENSPDWLIPRWPAPTRVRAVCSTRAWGSSNAPFDSLNLGDHVGDDPYAVAQNRAHHAKVLGVNPVYLSQVHGNEVLYVTGNTPAGSVADACWTDIPKVACTIMVADCLPVLLTTHQGRRVAAAHAGWRGLAGQNGVGILENSYHCFCHTEPDQQALSAMDIIAWLGPCIGPENFQVGDEVRLAFCQYQPQSITCFKPQSDGKWLADLAALARLRLTALGITQIFGNDSGPHWCTVGNPSRFFSHRRDGVSGRFAVSIWLD